MIGVDVSIENLTKPFKKIEVLQTMCIKHYESINKTSRSSLIYPEAVTQNCLRNPSKFFIDRGLGSPTWGFFSRMKKFHILVLVKV